MFWRCNLYESPAHIEWVEDGRVEDRLPPLF